MSNIKEQKRADFALACITGKYQGGVDDKTVNCIQGAPSQILQNGLGQAMAFWAGKDEKDQKQKFVFDTVAQWLQKEGHVTGSDKKAFLTAVNKMDVDTYLNAQSESLALLQWLKRYAKAFEKEKKQDKGPGGRQ